MKHKQFEVWIADLNPRFGTESGKTRPVLVIQTDLLNSVHPSAIVCPITTNVKQETSILRVNLEKGQAGLYEQSAIMIDQMRAIDNRRLLEKLGQLSASTISRVKENIQIVLDLI